MTPSDPFRRPGATHTYPPGPHTPFDLAIAAGLWWAMALTLLYPPRGPQRVDGMRATEEYARENDLQR